MKTRRAAHRRVRRGAEIKYVEVLAKLPSMAFLQDETGKCDFPVSSFSTDYSRRK